MKYLLSAALLLSSSLAFSASYSGIVVFGDSLADTGNLAATNYLPFLNAAPYFQGHGTNGKVAVEYMAEQLQLPLATSYHLSGQVYGNNFAVYGARTGAGQPIDLSYQVGAYLQSQGGLASRDHLYVLIIGANDVRAARDSGDWKQGSQIVSQAIVDLEKNLGLLLAAGARHILIANVPDLANVPETRLLASFYGDSVKTLAGLFTLQYDFQLLGIVTKAKAKHPGRSLRIFDSYREFARLLHRADDYGFTNNFDNCWSGYQFVYQNGCDASQFDDFVFFDELHPTTHAAEILGNRLYQLAQ